MKRTILSLSLLLVAPAFGQTMYRCPDASGVATLYQQMPCAGGEVLRVRAIPSGAGSGLSDEGLNYLREVEKMRAEEARVRAEEAKEARRLAAEHHKARAMEAQAAAILATLPRRR